jgi:hypothetical protein
VPPRARRFDDETYLKIAGRWTYLYRAVDQYGQVIDVLLSARPDMTAARRFFTRGAARRHGPGRGHHRPRVRSPRACFVVRGARGQAGCAS